jgi:hypothetical protein
MEIFNQSFQLNGEATKYIYNVVAADSSILLFDTYTGEALVQFAPEHGQTVTVTSEGLSQVTRLSPSLNNKLYYLVSDVKYDESQLNEMISLATEIPVYFANYYIPNGLFIGEFTFLNPNNYEYAYFLWDYSDKILNSASYIGETDNRPVSIEFGNDLGRCGIKYSVTSYPTRFQLFVDEELQFDTGYIGLNTLQNYDDLISAGVNPSDISLSFPYDGSVNNGSGSLLTTKNSEVLEATIVVSSPFTSSSWAIIKIDPYTTSFNINTTDDNDPCTKVTTPSSYLHNGSDISPIVGDIVYQSQNIYFNGEGLSYYIGNNTFITIDNDGVVTNVGNCYSTSPTAVPFIYEDDIIYNNTEAIQRPIKTIGEPISWTLVSSTPADQTVFVDSLLNIDLETAKGDYSIEVYATNSFGNSPNKTINISLPDLAVTRPVLIDIDQFQYESTNICALVSPVLTRMFFAGVEEFQDNPSVGSFIYKDCAGLEPFCGGGFWYYQEQIALRISNIGSVMDTAICTGTTTTTTSTTTVPAGDYFSASSCIDPSVIVTLLDTATQGINVGDIVNTDIDLNCWEILSVESPSYPYSLILDPVTIYADCSTCTGISTTTSTTTTTTAPIFTAFDLASINTKTNYSYNSCNVASPSYITHYHNGQSVLPVVGDFIYTNNTGTTPFNGQFVWYIMFNVVKYAVNIANTGQVINVIPCSVVTTTTTTTTRPVRQCLATRCDDGGITQILSYTSIDVYPVGTIVKDEFDFCYTVTNVSAIGTPYSFVVFLFDVCSDCLATITTTTTTSTTTTTTSTTTTTTTSAPVFNGLLLATNYTDDPCNEGVSNNYYSDGPIFINPYQLYTSEDLTVLAPQGHYRFIINGQGGTWDGNSWIDTFSCV